MSLKHRENKGKTSTDGSGEDLPDPGSTLSYLIVEFDPFWPGYPRLAMTYRLNGLSSREALTAGSHIAA